MSGSDLLLRATIEKYFGTSGSDTDEVLSHAETVRLDSNEWLFRQGDPGDSVYFLVRGRLQVWMRPAGASADSAPELLGEVVPGGSVGEVGLLTGAGRSGSVRAIRDSELVRVSRSEFEALAAAHPTLVMQLAGSIASVLRRRTTRAPSASSALKTVAVVRLTEDDHTRDFCRRLADALAVHGSAAWLSPDDLGGHGAPVDRLGPIEPVPESLRHWLHDTESDHRFLVYDCESDATTWSMYAMDQSDLVLFVATASHYAAPAEGENALNARTPDSNARRALVLLHKADAPRIAGTAAWLGPRRLDWHFHVRDGRDEDIARLARVIAGEAVGLVLAAGAARGIAHVGVYKAMCELGIPVDWVGGTSIGAIVAASIATYPELDALVRHTRDAFTGKNPFGDYTLPMIALLRGRRYERLLEHHLPHCIEDLAIPFFAVSCNLDSGAMNVHESGPVAAALRASAAMAGVMPPAVVGRQLAIDGSVLNSMPVDVMQAKPVGHVLAVDLSVRKAYDVPYSRVPSPWAVLAGRIFPFARRYRVPNLMTLMLKATEVGNLARVRELGRHADLLLAPPVQEFSILDMKPYDRLVEAGYRHSLQPLSEWKARHEQRNHGAT